MTRLGWEETERSGDSRGGDKGMTDEISLGLDKGPNPLGAPFLPSLSLRF